MLLCSTSFEEIVSRGEKEARSNTGAPASYGNASEVYHLPRSKLNRSPGFPYRNINCFQHLCAFVHEKALSEEQINAHYHQPIFVSAQSSVSRRAGGSRKQMWRADEAYTVEHSLPVRLANAARLRPLIDEGLVPRDRLVN